MMLEVELKLASTAGDLPQLEQALRNMSGYSPAERTMLTSTYYDTAASRLKRVGLVLQIQKQNGKYIQTVNREDASGGPPLARSDWQDVIAGEWPDLRAPNSSAHLLEALGEAERRARFTSVVQRTLFMLELDGSTQIAGALEEGEIRAVESERTEPICEVGLQLKRGEKSHRCASRRAARRSVAGFSKVRQPNRRPNTPCPSILNPT